MMVKKYTSIVDIDSDCVFIDQLSTQQSCHSDQDCSQQRYRQSPGKNCTGVVKAQQPIQRGQREHDHRDDGVAPAGNQTANTGHGYQIYNACRTSNPSTKSAYTGQPQTGAHPKRVAAQQETDIACDQRHQRGDREVDHHGMQRMAGYSRAANNRSLSSFFHGHFLWAEKVVQEMRLCIQRLTPQWVKSLSTPLALLASLLLAGCAGDKSILDPAGQAARDVVMIWWVMLGFGTVVLVLVTAFWLYTFKHKEVARTPAEERKIARRWIIGGGIVLPVASITALLAFGVPTGQRLLALPLGEPPEVIEVIGHQWWWEVRYPGAEGGEVVTSNQLIMPAGEPVDFHVSGADVIHAFWVPRLGGKIDMIPGRVNKIRLEADEPAVFGAQCAEFCGAQHAQMQLYVEAVARDEYEAWLADRQTNELSALAENDQQHEPAREAFMTHCASCHRVAGLSSGGEGPDLSDLGSRTSLGAGIMAMEEGAVTRWLQHHQDLKPGNKMPPHDDIETATLESLGAWLETLTP